MQQPWILVNKIEEAWTGVEENDRAIISKYDLYSRITLLLVSHVHRMSLQDTNTPVDIF